MDIEAIRVYCLSKKEVSESFPFDESVLVFKVLTKVFALVNIDQRPWSVNLKCDPEKAMEYRECYPEITPGYHMNKKHWNTVNFEGALPPIFLQDLITHSYEMVVSKMTKKDRNKIANNLNG